MKNFILLLLLFPLHSEAQKLKVNEYDKYTKKWRVETFPVNLKSAPGIKMDVSLTAADSAFFLQLMGSGIGANAVDMNSQLVLLLDNDTTVTVNATSVQSIDYAQLPPVYRHEYALSFEVLELFSRHSLQVLRKFSAKGFDDIYIEKKNEGKLRELSKLVLAGLKRGGLVPAKVSFISPAFPGGSEVLLGFLNRNLKPALALPAGEKKTVVVQFLVTADGSINELQLKGSAGPLLDNELLRILKRMPKWKPALSNGKQVDAIVTRPVTFFRSDALVKIQL